MRKLFFALLLAVPAFGQVTVSPFVSPGVQFLDNSGKPLNGGKVCTFAPNSTTPQAAYSDSLGTALLSNPIVLDSAGRATIFLTASTYKIVIAASTANSQCSPALQTVDGVTWATIGSTVSSLISTGNVSIQQSAAATSGANQSSPTDCIQGNYWTGAASAADKWCWQDVLGTGSNPTSTLTSTHTGSSGTKAVSLPALTVTGASSLSSVNNRIYVDGNKYALTAAGIQSAINDSITNKTYEVWLPCAQVSINATLTVTDNVSLVGCGPGEFNAAANQTSSALVWTGAAGSDLLQYTGASGQHLSNIHLSNLYLSGGRYALRIIFADIITLTNVAVVAGTTGNFYCGICTGIKLDNVQFVQIQSGATGLIMDNTNTVFMKSVAFESLAGVANPGVFAWAGGAQTHSINFEDVQADTFSATPTGFVKLAGYDGVSPWAGAPAQAVAGAARNTQFINSGFAYAVAGQSPASQGGEILIDGTAANPVRGVNFFGGNFDGQTITLGAQVAVKIDHAANVNFYGVTSRNHTAGSASTVTTTANSSNVNIYDTSSGTSGSTPDTQVFSGTAAAIGEIKSVDGNIAFNGLIPFVGNPASINFANNGVIGCNGLSCLQLNSAGMTALKPLSMGTNQLTSTVATGTAPLVVASTTPVANLSINGGGTVDGDVIGGVTPAAGTFTTLGTTGAVSKVNNVTTVGPGVCALVAKVDRTAVNADIAGTLLYAVPAAGGGMYRVSGYTVITTAAGVSSTLPNLQVVWTDADNSVAQPAVNITASSNGNSTGTNGLTGVGSAGAGAAMTINAKASTNINYQTTGYASNAANVMQFAAHIKVEFCGN